MSTVTRPTKKKTAEDDQFFNPTKKNTVLAETLAAAKAEVEQHQQQQSKKTADHPHASLKNPTRPFTPANSERKLFYGTDYSRPVTSVGQVNAGLFESPSVGSLSDAMSPPITPLTGSRAAKQTPTKTTSKPSTPLAATQTTTTPSPTPPAAVKSGPEERQWEEIKKLRPLLDNKNDYGMQATGLSQLITLIGEDTREFDFNTTLVPKRHQYVLFLLGKLMNNANSVEAPTATMAAKNKAAEIPAEVSIKLCTLFFVLKAKPELLNAAAKLIYSLSRNRENDGLFKRDHVVSALLGALRSPFEMQFTTLLYVCGALKHLSEVDEFRTDLVARQVVHLFANLINPALIADRLQTMAEKEKSIKGDPKVRIPQLNVQITAILRNLAVSSKDTKRAFLESSVVPSLIALPQSFPRHEELALNVSKVLTKLSNWKDCLQAIATTPAVVETLMRMTMDYPHNSALVVRTCYVLGNLTSDSEEHRLTVAKLNGVDNLLKLLQWYTQKDLELNCSKEKDVAVGPDVAATCDVTPSSDVTAANNNSNSAEIEQVMVKLIRLIANLAISREVGPKIGAHPGVAVLVKLLQDKTPVMEKCEELTLNIVGAITNISFYYDSPMGNIITSQQLDISALLVPLLVDENEESAIEAIRAFGNFSQSPEVKEMVLSRRVDEILSVILEHPNREVVFNACGVVMNIAMDIATRHVPVCQEMIPKLLLLMETSCKSPTLPLSLDLATVVGKTLYNICIDDRISLLTAEQVDGLRRSVSSLLAVLHSLTGVRHSTDLPDVCNELLLLCDQYH